MVVGGAVAAHGAACCGGVEGTAVPGAVLLGGSLVGLAANAAIGPLNVNVTVFSAISNGSEVVFTAAIVVLALAARESPRRLGDLDV